MYYSGNKARDWILEAGRKNPWKFKVTALVVKWISRDASDVVLQVRVLPRAFEQLTMKENIEKHFVGQITQKACIQRDGKVLLTQCPKNGTRAAGTLDMPGGRLHENEAVIDGLKREVREEIGVEIIVGKIIATGTLINMSNFPTYFVIYSCSLADPNATFTLEAEEVEKIGWYETKDFLVLPIIYREYQEALKSFLI